MSVRRSNYVVVGVNIGKEHYDDNKFEDVYEKYSRNYKVGEITYLIDGYSGEYFIVGQVLASDCDGYDGVSLDLSSVSDTLLEQMKQNVFNHIKDNFGLETKPSIIIKTHWH